MNSIVFGKRKAFKRAYAAEYAVAEFGYVFNGGDLYSSQGGAGKSFVLSLLYNRVFAENNGRQSCKLVKRGFFECDKTVAEIQRGNCRTLEHRFVEHKLVCRAIC